MKAVHITPTRNLESIKAQGIFRAVPLLDQYARLMERDYKSYDPERGLVFAFALDMNVIKWFKDFAYWKVWGTPRNECITNHWFDPPEKFDKLQEIGPPAFSHITPKDEHLSAVLIDIPDNRFYGWYYHAQNHTMNSHWADMEERYEHNTKPLVLINYDVQPDCIRSTIGTAETVLSKSGKVDILLNMTREKLL
jgi:hypothetical protein